jgi:hypothetical protein
MDVGLLPPSRSLNQDRSLCASQFVRPPQTWKHAILTTLLFTGVENTDDILQNILEYTFGGAKELMVIFF